MLGLYTHATGCFVRDSVDPDYTSSFPFYSTEHCLGYLSWRFIIWPGIIYFGERVWREVRARRATRLSKVLVHPSGAYLLQQNRFQSLISHNLDQVPWSFVLSSQVSSTPPANGYLSKSRSYHVSNGILCVFDHFPIVSAVIDGFDSSPSLPHPRTRMSLSTFVKLVISPAHLVTVLVLALLSWLQ